MFAATPNNGTVLADPDHMVAMVDRLTTLLTVFPTGPVTETLEALITVVKVLAHGVLSGLGGLASMRPQDQFLRRVNRDTASSADYFAIAANYAPTDAGLRGLVATMDLWYGANDRFEITVSAPNGASSGTVNAGTSTTLSLSNGNQVFIDSSLANPFNGDNRIFLRLLPGSLPDIAAGTWTLRLHATKLAAGDFHIWAQRGDRLRFHAPHVSSESTISIPGTAKRILTVGSFVSRFAGGSVLNDRSAFSSRGPPDLRAHAHAHDGRSSPTLTQGRLLRCLHRCHTQQQLGPGQAARGVSSRESSGPHHRNA